MLAPLLEILSTHIGQNLLYTISLQAAWPLQQVQRTRAAKSTSFLTAWHLDSLFIFLFQRKDCKGIAVV